MGSLGSEWNSLLRHLTENLLALVEFRHVRVRVVVSPREYLFPLLDKGTSGDKYRNIEERIVEICLEVELVGDV